MKLATPFEILTKKKRLLIGLGWLTLLIIIWALYGTGDTHMFPTLPQVWTGFTGLWNEGLMVHVVSSLWLCARAVILSIFIALSFVYLSPIPLVKPIANMISKFRYLPLTGIAFYITMLVSDGRSIQIWILVTFMTTYLTTSLVLIISKLSTCMVKTTPLFKVTVTSKTLPLPK